MRMSPPRRSGAFGFGRRNRATSARLTTVSLREASVPFAAGKVLAVRVLDAGLAQAAALVSGGLGDRRAAVSRFFVD